MTDLPPPTPSPPPGWYPEPGSGHQRYWDGAAWGAYAPGVAAPAPPAASTNGLAIASLVLSILWGFGLLSLLAVIFGAIGRKQALENGQGGAGLALAGLIIGIVGIVGAILIIIAAATSNDTSYTYTTYGP